MMYYPQALHVTLHGGTHKRKDSGFKSSTRAKKKSRLPLGDLVLQSQDSILCPLNAYVRRRKVSLSDMLETPNKENAFFFNSIPFRKGRAIKKYAPLSSAFIVHDIQGALPTINDSKSNMFDILPAEAILLILSFLPSRSDVFSLRLCNNYCNELMRDPSLRRKMYADDLDRENEEFYTISCDYMLNVQQGISPSMRSVLIEWLIEVADELQFHPETLFICVNLIDRYLSAEQISKRRLQLLGTTAMLVASKYEETLVPRIDDFVTLSDNLYTKPEVLDMESGLLTTVAFHVSAVTPRTFLPKFLSSLPTSDVTIVHLSSFILELALLDYPASRLTPSLVAASALCIALHVLGYSAWTYTLELFTQCSITDLNMTECVDLLFKLLQQSHNAQYVHEKYAQPRYCEVALLALPAEAPRDVSRFFREPLV